MNITQEIIKVKPLVYGTYMATMDVFMLGILKAIHLGWINKAFLFLPTLIYAMQPWVFLSSLKYENMTVMNLLWDVLSGVMVTGTGLYFFNETVTKTQMIGVGFAFVAIILLTCGDLCA
jgi:multidrug transporter EmrE-like cation transporter